MKLRDFAAAIYLPLIVSFYIYPAHRPADFEAALNQDGTWSITGEIEDANAKLFDAEYRCLVAQLKAIRPASNPNPDNTAPMTPERMKEIVCADPIAAPCLCPAAIS